MLWCWWPGWVWAREPPGQTSPAAQGRWILAGSGAWSPPAARDSVSVACPVFLERRLEPLRRVGEDVW